MSNDFKGDVLSLTDEKVQHSSVEDIFKTLQSSAAGLSASETQSRLEQFGRNELAEKKESPLITFLLYFWGPIPWMIEAAAILSLLASDFRDFIIIAAMLIFNALIGFWEEHKASNALAALKAGLALKARALRDGKWGEVEAATLVPGDVIRIRLGDIVPADVKLFDGQYVSIDQAALTGESLPVSKKIGDTAYSGSVVKQGEMLAVVTSTGGNTFFGRTAKLVEDAGSISHFQQAVMRVGDFLIFLSIGLCLLLATVVIYRDLANRAEGLTMHSVLALVKFMLILAVASIPVAMPAVLSVTMALGALALSKQKAIVSKLQSIEEMAGVDILCSDKTGTLTQNRLTLGEATLFNASDPQQCILAASLASKEEDHDAIDLAIISGLADRSEFEKYQQTNFVPFDPVSKRTEGHVKGPNGAKRCTKGAPHVIVDMCKLAAEDAKCVDETVRQLAGRGYRALGVAESCDEGNTWKFLGVLSLFDPPREDSADTIRQAGEHGINVKMVTGDDTAIASEISGKLGMGTHIQPANTLFTDGADPNSLNPQQAMAIERADGFARVFPEHKYGIVKALQSRGHIVAMTGDGVNDAPALKQADCGIAVSGATDAARAAAALVLTMPGLSVIINAVDTARKIFERMMSYTIYRIAMTMDVMFFVVLAMLIFSIPDFTPLTPVMIVILALLDDIPIMTIAYDNARTSSMPQKWQMGRTLTISSVLGVLAVVETFGLFLWGMHNVGQEFFNVKIDYTHLQTMAFLQLVVGGHLMLFVTRTKRSLLLPSYPSLPLFAAIVGTQIFAAILCGVGWDKVIPRLPWQFIGLVWIYNLVWMFILDIAKLATYAIMDNRTRERTWVRKALSSHLHHHGSLHAR